MNNLNIFNILLIYSKFQTPNQPNETFLVMLHISNRFPLFVRCKGNDNTISFVNIVAY